MTKRTKPSLFFPMGIPMEAGYRNSSAAKPVGPHAHNGAEIYLTLTALPDVLLDDQVFAVPADTLIIIPPFCVHQLYHEANVVYERYVLNLQDAWLKSALFDLSTALPCLFQDAQPMLLTLTETQKKELTDQFRKLLSFSRMTEPLALACFFTLLDLVYKLAPAGSSEFAHSAHASASQQKVNEMIAYIQEHVRENMTINDLAQHFFLHPDYLGRLFKQHAHVTVGHFMTLQKISTAQTLLREGRTVNEAAEELGFSSYAYFFKTFQKTAGISPSKYRALFAGERSAK